MAYLPLLTLFPVLIAVGYCDLRYMRIPNVLSLIALGLFLVWCLIMPPENLIARLTAAAVVFAIGFTGFAFRILGGGDVKALSVLMLFVPTSSVLVFANVLSASLLLGVTLVILMRQTSLVGKSGWKSISGSTRFPMGISIAFAGIVHPLVMNFV